MPMFIRNPRRLARQFFWRLALPAPCSLIARAGGRFATASADSPPSPAAPGISGKRDIRSVAKPLRKDGNRVSTPPSRKRNEPSPALRKDGNRVSTPPRWRIPRHGARFPAAPARFLNRNDLETGCEMMAKRLGGRREIRESDGIWTGLEISSGIGNACRGVPLRREPESMACLGPNRREHAIPAGRHNAGEKR